MDNLSSEDRGKLMSKVRSKDTKPELLVRRAVTAMGYRYRLHCRDLPGSPDLVFLGRRKVIFVHGCFWHRHPGCKLTTTPATRESFWREKFSRNVERDATNLHRLHAMGWKTLVVWECETRKSSVLEERIRDFLAEPR